jgi:hypothetical protein
VQAEQTSVCYKANTKTVQIHEDQPLKKNFAVRKAVLGNNNDDDDNNNNNNRTVG